MSETLDEVGALLKERARALQQKKGRLEQIQLDLSAILHSAEECDQQLTTLTEVGTIFRELEGTWHKSFEQRLAALVSRGLTVVFNEPLRFTLESKVRGDLSAMEFKLVQTIGDDELTTDILGAKGGGVVCVVSFLLRVLLIMASKGKLAPFIALDESFAMVSDDYVPNMASLLRELVSTTGIQILLITHQSTFAEYADVTYNVEQIAGESTYKLDSRTTLLV